MFDLCWFEGLGFGVLYVVVGASGPSHLSVSAVASEAVVACFSLLGMLVPFHNMRA